MSLDNNGVVTPGVGVTLLFLVGEWDILLLLLTLLPLEGVPEVILFNLLEIDGATFWSLLTTLPALGELLCVVWTTDEGIVLLFELFFCGVTGVILATAVAPPFLLLTNGGVEKDTE